MIQEQEAPMAVPVCPATLFAAGLLLDILTAVYYMTVAKEKIFAAVILNFFCIEFGYISWIYLMSQAKLEENLNNVHWYAAGCAVGTLIGLTVVIWRRKKTAPEEPPKRGRVARAPMVYDILVS